MKISSHGGWRKGGGKPPNLKRARELKRLWEPTRKVHETCKNGHVFTDETTVWRMLRGRASRRCRICHNAYHKTKGRERRWEVNLRKSLLAAEKVLLRLIRNVGETDQRVVKLATKFGIEARRRWRVALATQRSK